MSKRKPIDAQRDYISKCSDRHFFRVYESLVYSEAFKQLTPSAKTLFFYMGLESRGNRQFEYPKSKYESVFSKDGFSKAKKQLIEKGFLREVKYKTAKNQYSFSDEWKRWKTEKEMPG